MAFSSVQFLFVFLPLALAVYYVLPKRARNVVLCLFSLVFFAWSGLRGAALLVVMAALNWLGGLLLGRFSHKKPLLALMIAANLAVLGLSPGNLVSLGNMIQWARSYNAIFNKQYLWIGAPIVATVILFIGLFLLITGYNDYLSMKRGR